MVHIIYIIMKLKSLLLITSIIICSQVNAQKINLLPEEETTSVNISGGVGYAQIRIPYINIVRNKTDNGTFNVISSPILTTTFGNGEPMLPQYNKILEFEKSGDYIFTITKKDSTIIYLNKTSYGYPLMPAQKPTINGANSQDKQLIINQNIYAKDTLWHQLSVNLTNLGNMRNQFLVRLNIVPFNYNPAKNQLVIYHTIDIKIYNKNQSLKKSSQGEVIKSNSNTYLIITHPKYQNSVKQFAAWKTMQGYKVKTAYVTVDVSNTCDDIKTYIKNFYNNPPTGYQKPQYVLFAADEKAVPSFEGRQSYPEVVPDIVQQTDLYYCDIDGNSLPEIMYGRLSATDNESMQNIVDKIVAYEKTEFADPDFLNRMIFISGVDNPNAKIFSNTSLKYIVNNYANTTNGITTKLYPYNENYGVMDCANSGAAASILQEITNGAGLVFYHGHGNPYSWDKPEITYDDIDNMNECETGFWIANCCLTSKYHADNCFAESVIRKPKGGAVGYIGAANETIWQYDFIWLIGSMLGNDVSDQYSQSNSGAVDALYHTKTNESSIDNQYITAAQILNRGNLAVTQCNQIGYKYYWEVFNLMGDPSMLVHWKKPEANHVEYYPKTLSAGNTMLTVETSPYSLVALSQNDILIASAYTDNDGTAMLQFSADKLKAGEATLVVTAQNKATYIGTLTINDAQTITLGITACKFSKLPANNDSAYISFDIKNLTTQQSSEFQATNINIDLTTTNPDIEIIKQSTTIDNLDPQDTKTLENAFKIKFSKNYPHNTNAKLLITLTYNTNLEQQYLINTAVATPMIEFKFNSISDKGNQFEIVGTPETQIDFNQLYEYSISTTTAANINQILEGGEEATLSFNISNTGKVAIKTATAKLTSSHKGISITNQTLLINNLGGGKNVNLDYAVKLSDTYQTSENVDFTLTIDYDGYPASFTKQLTINAEVEDFEHNGELPEPITILSRRPWLISENNPYSGKYCFESADISNQSQSYFKIDVYLPQNDTIKFYVKTSCEEYNALNDIYYDHLEFAIDGNVQQKWAGITPWTEIKMPLTAGQHTLKWLYFKDETTSENEDKAWVDEITFPPCSYVNTDNSPKFSAYLPQWLTIDTNNDGTAKISGNSPNYYSYDSVYINVRYKNQTQTQKFAITTGSDENKGSADDMVRIYPIPATEFCYISINGLLKYNTLRLFDANGKKALQQDINSNLIQLYVSNLKSGVYILELKGESGKIRRRIAVLK